MRHTKIIATVGPASSSEAALAGLINAGTDVFRLNFSHGTQASHAETLHRIRAAAERAGRQVAVLQDLSGPKIRTGRLEGGRALELAPGDALVIATGDFVGGRSSSAGARVSTTFEGLARAVHEGDRLLLADGVIELRVERTDGQEVRTRVVEGGTLGEHKGINAPGVELPASAVTEKDADDLRFGLALGVDVVAVSFVQTPDDLVRARQIMSEANGVDVPLVAKLERPRALDRLDDILDVCDGVMVARGDLGLEMPLEHVPRAQKEITHAARHHQKPVIVATQVLESMTTQARPTRAEVSDAANAVDDGVDAIMLAAETAVGVNPSRAVLTLDAILRDAELSLPERSTTMRRAQLDCDHAQALCEAAVTLAERSDAHAIVAVTRGGGTVRRLAALRPKPPVIATTDRDQTARRTALLWGVTPVRTDIGERVDSAPLIGRHLVTLGLVPAGATAVFVSINPDLARTDANYLNIQRV